MWAAGTEESWVSLGRQAEREGGGVCGSTRHEPGVWRRCVDRGGLDVCPASMSAMVLPLLCHCSKFTDLCQESPTGSKGLQRVTSEKKGTLKDGTEKTMWTSPNFQKCDTSTKYGNVESTCLPACPQPCLCRTCKAFPTESCSANRSAKITTWHTIQMYR